MLATAQICMPLWLTVDDALKDFQHVLSVHPWFVDHDLRGCQVVLGFLQNRRLPQRSVGWKMMKMGLYFRSSLTLFSVLANGHNGKCCSNGQFREGS